MFSQDIKKVNLPKQTTTTKKADSQSILSQENKVYVPICSVFFFLCTVHCFEMTCSKWRQAKTKHISTSYSLTVMHGGGVLIIRSTLQL